MSEIKKLNQAQRRYRVAEALRDGYRSSRGIAGRLLAVHGVQVHHTTIASDMERIAAESPPKAPDMAERYESRVRDLSDMLLDEDLSKREKLAVHRTLNETESKLTALREKVKEESGKKSWETEEARHAHNMMVKERLEKLGAEANAERKKLWRAEWEAELREKEQK